MNTHHDLKIESDWEENAQKDVLVSQSNAENKDRNLIDVKIWKDTHTFIEKIEIDDEDDIKFSPFQTTNYSNQPMENQLQYTNSNPMMQLQFAASSITSVDPTMMDDDKNQQQLFGL